VIINKKGREDIMIMDVTTTKMYLKNSSKAILDAKNSLYTESELQLGINLIYNELELKQKGTKLSVHAFGGEAAQYITAQYYLDSIVKPTLEKLNQILGWKLKSYKNIYF
jgi:hypothetical protein